MKVSWSWVSMEEFQTNQTGCWSSGWLICSWYAYWLVNVVLSLCVCPQGQTDFNKDQITFEWRNYISGVLAWNLFFKKRKIKKKIREQSLGSELTVWKQQSWGWAGLSHCCSGVGPSWGNVTLLPARKRKKGQKVGNSYFCRHDLLLVHSSIAFLSF